MAPDNPEASRFFLDSSVILSGCASSAGASHVLLVRAQFGLIRAITLPYAFVEVERNLKTKLNKGIGRYQEIRETIDWEMQPNPDSYALQSWVNLVPVKDTPILAAAVAAQPARLVTLDTKHFISDPQVAQSTGLMIVTPGYAVSQIRHAIYIGIL